MKDLVRIFDFQELSNQLLYAIMQMRIEVFIVEQHCPYQDADNIDQYAQHVVSFDNDGNISGYARILKPGLSYDTFTSIGRVITHPDHRNRGIGQLIMRSAIRYLKIHHPDQSIKIGAQCYALEWYKGLGFEIEGNIYLEDGIPHQHMIYRH